MDLGIKNKVMIVTGGARGIGEGIVRCLAGEGAIPVIADNAHDAGEFLMNDVTRENHEAWFIETDVSEASNCKKVVEKTQVKYGRIDALFNNVGINDGVGLEKGSPDKFLKSLSNNLHHYYFMAHYALNALKATKGSIVNISSKVAVTGQGNTSGYAAAKGAQLALTREWAVELLPYKIRVNTIIPAEVMTPSYERWINKQDNTYESLEKITKKIPFENRMTTKEEIASMAVYLVSKQASHITGQFLYVDGGYVHLDRMVSG
jgi:NAD(P)-dependent dehydrogenase (short-subunit alcohol dehydrogenase family)